MKKKWWHNSTIYQVYPRSFKDSNDDGIGDLKGITSKLDHIKDLGTDIIWLSPVYKSPMDDNGYDISDYYSIDPLFGTMEDMDELIKEANDRGIKIVMDLVVNHTSDEHPWFIESKSSKDNPKRDWYIWKDGKEDGTEPNNWKSFFTPKAWEYDEVTKQYYLHLFSKKQPDLNWENKEVREAVYEMMHFWLKKGIGGFRMDVISSIAKPSDFPEGTITNGGVLGWEHWANNVQTHKYLREMNDKVLRHYDIVTVGETSYVNTRDGMFYSHPDRKELDMVFQFEHMGIDVDRENFTDKGFDLVKFKEIMGKWQEDLFNNGWNSLYLCNHDQARPVSRFSNDSVEYREKTAKLLGAVLHFMNGTPYVYQGEEIGTTNTNFESIDEINDISGKFVYSQMKEMGRTDKEAMKFLNKFSRDHARVPIAWDDSQHSGFSNSKPWLKLNTNYKTINVKESVSNENSVYHFYKKLISLRKDSKYSDVMVYGEYKVIDILDEAVYAYTRCNKNTTLMLIANFTDKEQTRSFDGSFKEVVVSNYDVHSSDLKNVVLRPYEVVVVEI